MKKLSKINLNLIKEKLYTESLVNKLYYDIAYYDEKEIEPKKIFESIIKEEKDKSIISDIVNDLKLAPKFIFSFGTGIGAFYESVDILLSGSGFQMTEYQTYLLIITAVALLLNEMDGDRLVEKLKEEGIYSALDSVTEYISNTKKIINTVVKKSLGVTYSLADILAFTALLVPTTDLLSEIINEYGLTTKTVNSMIKGVILAATVYGVKSIVKRIKNKLN